MGQEEDTLRPEPEDYLGSYENGMVRLAARTSWPDGTPVCVRVATLTPEVAARRFGRVILAGFGLAGRWVADIFDRHGIEYVIVEENLETVQTQLKLNRPSIAGNIATEETLQRAGIETASILILTTPEESVVLEATRIARRLKPEIYIVARTTHVSTGIQASQCGADEVIKAEQVVARHFFEMLLRKVVGVDPPSRGRSLSR